ncbi:MAG: excinuclease ABC subunit UvrB [Candidatus Lokiarchaeota archaeon]|nr:excinuclease ABC subunit UvrB [Candidatus Lokiarchaeota archaeon]
MSSEFNLESEFEPKGDQPKAIEILAENINKGKRFQTLLGATGTGKSLDYNEMLLIFDSINKIIQKVKIGKFVEANLHGATKSEGTEYNDIQGYKILSFNESTNLIEKKNIIQISKHKEEIIYEITLDDFSSIRVTKDHNCYKLINCKLALCSTKELRVGDYLPCSNVIISPKNGKKFINLLNYNDDVKLNIKELILNHQEHENIIKEVLREEHSAYNWKYGQIIDATKEKGIKISTLNTLMNHLNLDLPKINSTVNIICKGNQKLHPLLNIDDNFLIFSGLYLSEGHCTDRYILISNSNISLQNKCKAFFNSLGLEYIQRNKNDIQFNSKHLANFYRTMGATAHDKCIPSIFYNLTEKQLIPFIRSLFDGDGWVEKSAVCYLSASKQLVFDIKNLLLRFNITSRISKKKKKYKSSIKAYYQLTISGQKNLTKFLKSISFSIQYKKEKLQSILSKKTNTNVDLIPNCQKYIRNLRKRLNYSQIKFAQEIGCSRSYIGYLENGLRSPSKSTFKKIIHLDKRIEKEELNNLLQFNFRKIVKIQKIKSSNGYVYDIAVKDNQNFNAGNGNIFVHNTFTVANIIEKIQKPTLVMAPNKTLAAQLYNELKELFPGNAVHYFVSYYDYYQPEAYIPTTAMYIEKDFSVNEEIERLRLAATHAVRTRKDVIVVATVSCIYGIGNPEVWTNVALSLEVGQSIDRREIIDRLIKMNYERKNVDFRPGILRVKGDIIDVFPAYLETGIRISLFGDEIESITEIHPVSYNKIKDIPNIRIFPATHFIIPDENKKQALISIEEELEEQLENFREEGKYAEAQRLEQRVKFDLEMMREMGYCKGIENYSRHLDGREPGTPPMCLIDYFPEDFLIVVDESHISIPQIHGMIGGDRSRKKNLVEYGWRLPSAFDNRPLTFDEWKSKIEYIIFMSATPGDWELKKSGGISAEQIIRPTGLVDPAVEVRSAKNQIDNLLAEIRKVISNNGRILITTLTKRMAEDIAEYYSELGIKIAYLHSEVDTVERFEILRKLRDGTYDAIVGINLLREGLDLPEVQLVAILDADKLGFLRDERSLIQTIGRASRNVNGKAILYGDRITKAMKEAIEETNRRRRKQTKFNETHNITPQTIKKNILRSLSEEKETKEKEAKRLKKSIEQKIEEMGDMDVILQYLENKMYLAAKELRFEDAAFLRDKINDIKKSYKSKV